MKLMRTFLAGGALALASFLTGCTAPPPSAPPAPPAVSVSLPIEREVTDHADYTGRIAAVGIDKPMACLRAS